MKKRIIVALAVTLFLFNYANAEVSQQDAQRYSAYYSNGMQYLKNQQFSSAIVEFKKVLRFSPYDLTIQQALASAYYARAQYYRSTTKEIKKALVDCKSAYFYAKYWNNQISDSLNSLASACLKDINDFEKRLAINSTPQARYNNARALRAQGELAAAGYDFQQLKNGEFSSSAYENLGNIYKIYLVQCLAQKGMFNCFN